MIILKMNMVTTEDYYSLTLIHCVKSARIQSYSFPHFPSFGLNTERYRVSLHIKSKCRKMQTRITPSTDIFHAVESLMYEIKMEDVYEDIKQEG